MVNHLGDVVKECSRDIVDKVEEITSGRRYNTKEFDVEEWISDVDWDVSSSDQSNDETCDSIDEVSDDANENF